MSATLTKVSEFVALGDVRISAHGYDELAADDILAGEALDGIVGAVSDEDYPNDARGPSVLVLQRDGAGHPIHVVWGIPKAGPGFAVLITAYRPDPARWTGDFKQRKT